MKRWTVYLRRYGTVLALLGLAVLADVLANDVPLLARQAGQWSSPVGVEWLRSRRVTGSSAIRRKAAVDYDWALWPPIAYAPSVTAYGEALLPPLAAGSRGRHWLGTDALGRDVAAGLVHGARTALWIGGSAMALAGLVGILLGGVAGYFGNGGLRVSLWRVLAVLAFVLMVGYLWSFGLLGAGLSANAARCGLALLALVVGGSVVVLGLERWRRVSWGVPADGAVQRGVEILDAIPALIVLLALLAVLDAVNVGTTIVVIALVTWPRVARLVRAEMLRIRELPYVVSARVAGLPAWRIWWRYALPNALGAAAVTLAFGVASAVLLEATLSFLGLSGVPPMESWGGMLQLARESRGAWWLAVCPGAMLFVTVRAFSRLGELAQAG